MLFASDIRPGEIIGMLIVFGIPAFLLYGLWRIIMAWVSKPTVKITRRTYWQ